MPRTRRSARTVEQECAADASATRSSSPPGSCRLFRLILPLA
ncbi:hypothetical protein [Methylobacterium nigriterrae]